MADIIREAREATDEAIEELKELIEQAEGIGNHMKESSEEITYVAASSSIHDIQAQELKDAVTGEEAIPGKLREHILAKFAEDEAKIAELERLVNGAYACGGNCGGGCC